MVFLRRMIDVVTLGSDRPMQRLLAYYGALAVVVVALLYLAPSTRDAFFGTEAAQEASMPQLLQDGLTSSAPVEQAIRVNDKIDLTLDTLLSFALSFLLMLPVSWVYMSTGKNKSHSQDLAQTLLVLPLVVAGVVFVVQSSLALAFSLAGVVAAVRFRASLSETRDVVFVFLAIGVGFAAGVQMLMLAALMSVFVNFVLLFIWRYDFGRNILAPTANSELAQSLSRIAGVRSDGKPIPDRDLVVALTPNKADELAQRFKRVRETLGSNGKKPRYNSIVSVTTTHVNEARTAVEAALENVTKRWRFDEIVEHNGKPSELYYLVRSRKDVPRDRIVTEIRAKSNGSVENVDVEMGVALAAERSERKEMKKEEAAV